MLESLHLKNVGPAPEMEIHFRPRINLLTGDNGLGKTFLLDIAWWVLTRTWAGMPATPPRQGWKTPSGTERGTSVIQYGYRNGSGKPHEGESLFNRAEQSWSSKPAHPVAPGLVIYARSDGGFSIWDPARNAWKDRDTRHLDLPSAFHFGAREVWDGLPLDRPSKLCNGLILDWGNWQRENGEAFAQLVAVLQALSPSPDERLRPGRLTRIDVADARDHPTLKTAYGQEVPLVLASAGVRRIAALAYLLVWTWEEHRRAAEIRGVQPASEILFLVDEIENHLHPQWQRRILKSLLELMEALTSPGTVSVQLVATTHSPLILVSMETFFDSRKDALWGLDLVDSKVELQELPYIRRGVVDNWLTSPAIGLHQPRSLEAEQVLEKALALLRKTPTPPIREFEEVDRELRGVLGDIDPFWVRWSFLLEEMRGGA